MKRYISLCNFEADKMINAITLQFTSMDVHQHRIKGLNLMIQYKRPKLCCLWSRNFCSFLLLSGEAESEAQFSRKNEWMTGSAALLSYDLLLNLAQHDLFSLDWRFWRWVAGQASIKNAVIHFRLSLCRLSYKNADNVSHATPGRLWY